MDLSGLIARVRDHYLDQFEAFVEKQTATCERGSAEVKFEIPEPTALYRRLVCVDFVKNDGKVDAVFFKPEYVLSFDPISANLGSMAVSIAALMWDNVVIHHELAQLPEAEIAAWFQRWFDPEDQRNIGGSSLCNIIHSLDIRPGSICVDFGTASPDALIEMLRLLEAAGAASVRVDDASLQEH